MDEVPLRVREKDGGIEVAVRVQPRAGRNAVIGLHNGAIRVKITAPPVDGAANAALISLFSTVLDVPRSRLAITSGGKSRDKILRVEGASVEDILKIVRRASVESVENL